MSPGFGVRIKRRIPGIPVRQTECSLGRGLRELRLHTLPAPRGRWGGDRGRWGHSEQVLPGERQKYRVGRVLTWEEDEKSQSRKEYREGGRDGGGQGRKNLCRRGALESHSVYVSLPTGECGQGKT